MKRMTIEMFKGFVEEEVGGFKVIGDQFNGELRKWRRLIFDRDDYTCQHCKKSGGKLNAHHLNSWDKHPDDRFEITNGVTLCETCHRNFHKEFGYGSNDESQFEEFTASSPM